MTTMDLAELSRTSLAKYIAHSDSVTAVSQCDFDNQMRMSEIRATKLEQEKTMLEEANVILRDEIKLARKDYEKMSSRLQKSVDRISKELAESQAYANSVSLQNSQISARLEQTEKKLLAATQRAQELSEKLLADSNEIATEMEKSHEFQNVLLEEKYKYKALLEEKLKMESEVTRLNLELKSVRDSASGKQKSLKETSALEKKLRDAEEKGKAKDEQLAEAKSEITMLKAQVKELESKSKSLQKQVSALGADSANECKATDKSDKKEIKEMEKRYKDEVAALKTQLEKQTVLTEKSQKEVSKVKDQQAALQKRLETAQNKLKISATATATAAAGKKGGKNAPAPALPTARLLFTPETEKDARQKRGKQSTTLQDKPVEKSTFSMTPFLARQTSIAPLSPVDSNAAEGARAARRSMIGVKPMRLAMTKEAESAPLSEHESEEHTEQESATEGRSVDADENTTVSAEKTRKPVAKQSMAPSTAASLAALVSEELSNPTTSAAMQKKKKRKLGVARPPTLFDAAQEETEQTAPKRTKVVGFGIPKVAAPVAQRFTAGKAISPLKKRNENLRDMFKL
ncbi:hypothetical protein BZA70DRAFT_289644 [Myxozyma melibiosi]|uniref:Uncharacterized protein n=1 Tax=Myxozyma melibiosi TaxID=54550 RepID=A0ABR1F570_9ASCO